jgi:hypothetical protein
MSKVSDPQHWRRRAEEARTLADELTDAEAKRKMLKIAEDYGCDRVLQRLHLTTEPINFLIQTFAGLAAISAPRLRIAAPRAATRQRRTKPRRLR